MVQYPSEVVYSEKYHDKYYEYRHVLLTRQMTADAKALMDRKTNRLLAEPEWRRLGVQQSRGWEHYMQHKPEAHVLLFRRPLGTDPLTGQANPDWKPPPQSLMPQIVASTAK